MTGQSAPRFTPIPMAPGYAVTRDGRVFSVSSNWRGYGIREMSVALDDYGYPSVRVYINGKRKRVTVHRLVANTFLPDRPSPQHEIRHRDGDKLHSHTDNLLWGTPADNAADRELHGRTARGEKSPKSTLTQAQVCEIRDRVAFAPYLYQQRGAYRLLAPQYGVTPETISSVVRRKTWRHLP